MRQQFAPAAPGDVCKSSGKRGAERVARAIRSDTNSSLRAVYVLDGVVADITSICVRVCSIVRGGFLLLIA